MKIAIIGSGISGLTVAYKLYKEHDITVFEKNNYVGGHTNTVDVELDGENHRIDTGFIVYNDWTYPNFIQLLDELGIQNQKTVMSFSVSCEETGLEYNGNNLNSLFSQRSNILSPKFYGFIGDILRFNKKAKADLMTNTIELGVSLKEYLEAQNFGDYFLDKYIYPMGAAIWSTDVEKMYNFPALFFVRFFNHHGLLNVWNRPQWRVLKNGSKSYVEKMQKLFGKSIRTGAEVNSVERTGENVKIKSSGGEEVFDKVVFASHSNQTLNLIADPTDKERSLLKAIPYQKNEVVLHYDDTILPSRKLAWASWNYFIPKTKTVPTTVTYDMNILQSLKSKHTFCVTLNHFDKINPNKILYRTTYEHPEYLVESPEAQESWEEINGKNNSYFCGAYWRNGFHEDGVVSGIRVAKSILESNE